MTMLLTNKTTIQEVLFFPQMRPEKKQVEMTEEEKMIFELVKGNQPALLPEIKGMTDLSNKKWDVAMKGLSKKGVVSVRKEGENLFIDLAE